MIKSESNVIKNEKVTIISITIIFFLLNIMFVNKLYLPFVSGDEMGYMAPAAYLSRRNWSGTVQFLSYFSYGYSIFLIPIFALVKNPLTAYRAIIILNGFFVACVFPLSYLFLKRFLKSSNLLFNRYIIFISILITSYESNIVRANTVFAEALLMVVFWLIFLLFQSLLENYKNWKIVLLGFLVVYNYMVHPRMISTALAVSIVLIVLVITKKIKLKNLLLFFGTIVVLLFFHSLIKNLIQNKIWLNGQFLSINDYEGVFGKIKTIFSEVGIYLFVVTIIGHIFYFGVSTFLLGFISVCHILENIYDKTQKHLKEKLSFDNNFYIYVLAILCFLGMFGVSIIFMFDAKRLDNFMYGRYMEISFGVLIAIGLVYIFNEKQKLSNLFFGSAIVLFVISALLKASLSSFKEFHFAEISSIALSVFYKNEDMKYFLATIVAILVGFIIFYLNKKNNSKLFELSMLFTSGVSLFIGCFMMVNSIIPSGKINYKHNAPAEIIRADKTVENIYYLGHRMNMEGVFAQYLIFDKPILCFELYEDMNINDFKENHYLLTEQLSNEIINNYEFMDYVNGVFYLKPNKHQNNVFNIDAKKLLNLSNIDDNKDENTKIISSGQREPVLYGPHMILNKGKYKITIEMKILDDKETQNKLDELQKNGYDINTNDLAEIFIADRKLDEKYFTKEIKRTDFDNNKYTLEVTIDIIEKSYDFEIIVYGADGSIIELNNVSIS